MSDVERIRALTLVTIIGASLFALFLYQSRDGAPQLPAARDSLEVCAASKGALCDGVEVGTEEHLASKPEIAELGQIVVTEPRFHGEFARAFASGDVADLGSLTVSAPRREGSRVAENDGVETIVASKS